MTASTGAESGATLERVATIWTAICGRSFRTVTKMERDKSSCFSAGAERTSSAALAGISMAGSSLMVDNASVEAKADEASSSAATNTENLLNLNITIP